MSSNFWIDNFTVEGCIKQLKQWLEDATKGAVFNSSTAIGDIITDFYDAYPHFFDFMDEIYVEFCENQTDDGRFWYSNIDVSEYDPA
jgi:hypothetical protein